MQRSESMRPAAVFLFGDALFLLFGSVGDCFSPVAVVLIGTVSVDMVSTYYLVPGDACTSMYVFLLYRVPTRTVYYKYQPVCAAITHLRAINVTNIGKV